MKSYFFRQNYDILFLKFFIFENIFSSDIVNLTCTPFDTIKTRYQIREDTSMVNMTKQLYATEGVRGLYKGILLVRVNFLPKFSLIKYPAGTKGG